MPRVVRLKSESSDETSLLIPGCRTFQRCSSGTGLAYQIFVSVPDSPAPPSGFPVIYVLDGNAEFITVSETMTRVSRRPKTTGIGPAIVVGIGYPNTDGYNLDRRYLDFTRGLAADDAFTDVPADGCGGQKEYIAFLRDDLISEIDAQFPTDPTAAVLLGHSLAGYFVLDLLAQHPEMFAGYVSFSPSVWWDRPRLLNTIADAEIPSQTLRIFSAVGEREQEKAEPETIGSQAGSYSELRRSRRMIDNAREVVVAIDHSFGGRALVKFDVGADEDHATIVPAMLCRALRFVVGCSSRESS